VFFFLFSPFVMQVSSNQTIQLSAASIMAENIQVYNSGKIKLMVSLELQVTKIINFFFCFVIYW